MFGVEPEGRLCHGQRMTMRTPMAGGCLWTAAILLGTVWGITAGNPMKGVLAGTIGGGAIALLVWLLDRARR